MTISGSLCKNVLSGLFKSGLYIQLHTVHNFGVPCSVSEMQRVLKTAAWPNQTRRQSFTHIELVALNSEASGFSSGQEARNSLLPEAITCVILKFSWVSIWRVWIFFSCFTFSHVENHCMPGKWRQVHYQLTSFISSPLSVQFNAYNFSSKEWVFLDLRLI